MEKEQQKNNKGLLTITIVLSIIVIALVGYIIYDKSYCQRCQIEQAVNQVNTVK